MPHRIGYLWEKVIEESNCILAEINMAKNKPDSKMAKKIKNNSEKYGKILCEKLKLGYEFHTPKETDIVDSYKGKTRHLKIPCLEDQAAMQAWLNIASPYLIKRSYYFSCGSVPGAGQGRAVKSLKKKLKGKKSPKYAILTDIKKFYESIPHKLVIRELSRIFKDKKFVDFAGKMMTSMSPSGVGLAIGYPVSHWFANLSINRLDHELSRKFTDVWHVRYMDDVPLVSNNKRHLRKAFKYYLSSLKEVGLDIKSNHQLFPIRSRGISFLSYRFYNNFTILIKNLMIRISRRVKRYHNKLTLYNAMSILSYYGILKHCNSHNFFIKRVKDLVSFSRCRKFISIESKRCNYEY